jgi:hypothetical protein
LRANKNHLPSIGGGLMDEAINWEIKRAKCNHFCTSAHLSSLYIITQKIEEKLYIVSKFGHFSFWLDIG